MNGSNVQAVIKYHLNQVEEKQMSEAFSKQISVRLKVEQVFKLDRMAESLGLTRTGLATELLEAAITDAALVAGVADPVREGLDRDLLERDTEEFARRDNEYRSLFHQWLEKNGFKVNRNEDGSVKTLEALQ